MRSLAPSTSHPAPAIVKSIVLDIEGTTTPMAFVHETLFAYARLHLDAWLAEHGGSVGFGEVEAAFAREHASDPDGRKALLAWRRETVEDQRESIATYAWFLMDRDAKSSALKTLQGLIWEAGYAAGELRGEVYEDVPGAFRRWHDAGMRIAIYSSGSELAQRRLFESTRHGDLTRYISRYFDTRIGPKRDQASYARIADEVGVASAQLLFVSDVTDELAAARDAGCQTRLSLRPGNRSQARAGEFASVSSFDEIVVAPRGATE